ncbi:hypothetical protein FJ945_19725 [Mesorhizobium sp. B2-4-9]|uniref:DUF6998 domain-containing protein n=1 Tax=Mesorhizobium sp. B2-4-9 TaxID=2589940 RepID=UPI001127BB30|nr:hypothetical protein [Mesorhizobium sp. B2-4-9]TPL20975.1 hypothetical protein FJ945_19725 [Mesorhizobium sp. B2-4-9]
MLEFDLPPAIAGLVAARNKLRDHYKAVGLKFTLDGNLVGDLGEAIAVELFGLRLVEARSTAGIDGRSPDGRTVQVKATGTGSGPAFRQSETKAQHLLFFDLDFERAKGLVVFNGPEHIAVAALPTVFSGQRSLTKGRIRAADARVADSDRLRRVDIGG